LLVKLEGFKKGLTVATAEPLQMSQVNSPGSRGVITILPLQYFVKFLSIYIVRNS
jgi:hypothetical protein